jgi:hypothetical protein
MTIDPQPLTAPVSPEILALNNAHQRPASGSKDMAQVETTANQILECAPPRFTLIGFSLGGV